jgi:O-antigen/teichoic acid export membrane protein
VAIVSLAFAKEIISSLYDYYTNESIQVFGILMFCLIPVALTYIFGTLLTANGNLYKLNIIAFSGMCVNVVLNLILIPTYQAVGAASVSLLTQVFTALIQTLLAIRLFKIKIKTNEIFIHLLFAVLTLGIIFLSKYYIANWFVAIIISGMVSLGVAFVLKIMKPMVLFELFFASKK